MEVLEVKKQKSRFWTFIFSLIPGAGEMYMGFFKQGISIMGLFWLVAALSGLLGLGAILAILPILWFYSFFHVHSLKTMPEDEFYTVEDDFLFGFDNGIPNKGEFIQKYRKMLSISLIVVGFFILWRVVCGILIDILPAFYTEYIFALESMVPQTVIGIGIIYLGIYLIKGKKKELDYNEDA